MFNRFQNFMNQAVEAVAPQVKAKSQSLMDHWKFVAAYYDGTRGNNNADSAKHIDDTNISFHLISIIKYLKEEEMEQEQEQDGLTGPCMEELLHLKMPDSLVDWALLDKPRGMYVQVLRTFSLLISNVHHRLLPEATVRLPLERLIHNAHVLQDHPSDLPKIKNELLKLVNIVFRQFKDNPPLINLFTYERKGDSPVKSIVADGPTPTRTIESILLFDIVNQYLDSSDPGTAQLARESIDIVIQVFLRDSRLTDYLVYKSRCFEQWTKLLNSSFTSLPVTLGKYDQSDGGGVLLYQKRPEAPDKEGSPVRRRRSSSPLRTPNMPLDVPRFFQLWSFVNDVMETCFLPDMGGTVSSNGIRLGREILESLRAEFIHIGFRNGFYNSDSDRHSIAYTEYAAEMISDVSTEDVLRAILDVIFSSPGDEGNSELFGRRLLSKNEETTMAALRLAQALLLTYNQFVYNFFLLSDLHMSEKPEIPFESRKKTIEEIMTQGVSGTRIAQLKMKENASQAITTYDDYFFDAQDRNERIAAATKRWSPSESQYSSPAGSFNILDVLLLHFSRLHFNSPQRNLLVTDMLNCIASIPDERVSLWFLRTGKQGEGYQSPVDGRDTFLDTLNRVLEEGLEYSATIPDFMEKFRLMRRFCGDNLMTILHNLSTASDTDDVASMEARLTETVKDTFISEDLYIDPNEEVKVPPFSIFMPAYMTLTEFCKEISATLLIVDRNLRMETALRNIGR